MAGSWTAWAVRCLPGLSVLAILLLAECALQVGQTLTIGLTYPPGLLAGHQPVVAQSIFIAYSLFLHILAFLFPIRLCRSVWQAWAAVDKVYGPSTRGVAAFKEKDEDIPGVQQAKSESQSPHRMDHLRTVHAIMIPSYKEDFGVLEETLKILATHTLARSTYDVCYPPHLLQPCGDDVLTIADHAMRIRFSLPWRLETQTPCRWPRSSNLPGEVPGKSSNIGWAAQEVQRKYAGSPDWKDVLLTVMDSDTHLLSDYFKIILHKHIYNRSSGDVTDMTMYMPPIIFDRNAHLVPIMVRVADLMWCGAGLSCFQSKPGRNGVAFPTAVYTIPLPLMLLVEGWDTDAGAIGEDMHMMLKCYFATNGRIAFESIPSPASQGNISSSHLGIRGWVDSHRARYTQGLRHMWGCLDAGYAFEGWSKLGSTPPPSLSSRKLSRHSELELKLAHYQLHGDHGRKLTWRNVMLFTRVFEAHFLPIHLFFVMISSTIYTNLGVASPVRCRILTAVMDFTGILRAVSFITMLFYFFVFYEGYHKACVQARESEMKRVGLYEEMEDNFSKRAKSKPLTWLDYLVFPIAGIIFGSVPLMHAAFAHFFSDRLDYKVSAKPIRLLTKLASEGLEEQV